MSLPPLRTGVVYPAPETILDGYGVPFVPDRHLNFVRVGEASVRLSTYVDPNNTGYVDPNVAPKDKAAGFYEKGSGV